MNKTDIVQALTNDGVADADATFNKLLGIMTLGLACGEDIVIRNWGKLQPRQRSAVVRKNPRTGLLIEVPAKISVAFVPAPALKRRLNGGIKKPA